MRPCVVLVYIRNLKLEGYEDGRANTDGGSNAPGYFTPTAVVAQSVRVRGRGTFAPAVPFCPHGIRCSGEPSICLFSGRAALPAPREAFYRYYRLALCDLIYCLPATV